MLFALALLCYRAFSPFLPLMAWSIVLAVTMYPLHQRLARAVGGRQWLASTILVIIGFLLIITPTGLLMNSFADSVRNFIGAVQNNTLEIPAPSERVARWPIVGKEVYDTWSKAYADLPGLVHSMQPKIGVLAHRALAMVASIGGGLLLFLASFIIASILMAYGESGSHTSKETFQRIAGLERGEALVKLSTATIRAVALGVIGVAFIQAILIGLALLFAGVPSAGVLSIIALVLGIAQVPALVITVPVITYIWSSGDYSHWAAITYTVILLVAGMADNVLKPLMLGRGVAVPMPVILFGALGGIASGGILGMFVGATVLALGYHIFKVWIASTGDIEAGPQNERIKHGDSAKG
ncbi:MAG TPA: AI-2E family transporter [Chthoniobacterales bacterium]|nr:AI-2E family transporter [Chthoniobacterales bacterium]